MKTALITGANKGIGFETARQLAALGWHVLIGARNAARGEAACMRLREQGAKADFIEIDVSSRPSIEAAAGRVGQITRRLDVLINNAGILLPADQNILNAGPELVISVLQTNAIGALDVVQLFRPLLGRGSRVINISSGGGSMTDPVGGWSPVYCASKTLLNGITRQLAYTLGPEGILVNAMCPGWVKTDMGGAAAPRSVEQGAATAVWLASDPAADRYGYFWRDRKVIPW